MKFLWVFFLRKKFKIQPQGSPIDLKWKEGFHARLDKEIWFGILFFPSSRATRQNIWQFCFSGSRMKIVVKNRLEGFSHSQFLWQLLARLGGQRCDLQSENRATKRIFLQQSWYWSFTTSARICRQVSLVSICVLGVKLMGKLLRCTPGPSTLHRHCSEHTRQLWIPNLKSDIFKKSRNKSRISKRSNCNQTPLFFLLLMFESWNSNSDGNLKAMMLQFRFQLE